jgi:Predicted HD superfamily hydrolase
MSGYIGLKKLNTIVSGLNIEGYRPFFNLPTNCKWYNIIQVIDEPLEGHDFNSVMEIVRKNKLDYIESAVGIDINNYINQVSSMILKISENHKNVLVHIHQYTGTTILDKIIYERTKIKTILDDTNYFESPINYKEKYPNIDALISISQCAGFGLKAGQWIIPTYFHDFDVKNNIIYTKKIFVDNNIKKYVSFPYKEGAILVVNDLWNPDLEILDGVLLLDENDKLVLDFVKENTKIFDNSHDWHHALKVAYNSTKILNNKYVLYLALLHDVCDHKYTNSIPRTKLKQWIYDNLNDYKIIDEMIDLVSFSKQKSHKKVDPILEAVRDGDRIEAIGKIGIERCEEFVKSKDGKIPEDVIIHCYDKLLKIVPEKYIVSPIGLKIAKDQHNYVVQYVIDNLPKTNLKYDLPKFI